MNCSGQQIDWFGSVCSVYANGIDENNYLSLSYKTINYKVVKCCINQAFQNHKTVLCVKCLQIKFMEVNIRTKSSFKNVHPTKHSEQWHDSNVRYSRYLVFKVPNIAIVGLLSLYVFVTIYITPVSYTHLDVYKRQHLHRWVTKYSYNYF